MCRPSGVHTTSRGNRLAPEVRTAGVSRAMSYTQTSATPVPRSEYAIRFPSGEIAGA